MRSFRAENVSAFVKSLLDCEREAARQAFSQVSARYPIAVTRSLDCAKQWIRSHARGTERFGLVASSKAVRLKPHAIDIRVSVDPVHYFRTSQTIRASSYYLEDAATEFRCTGLELRLGCASPGTAIFRFNESGWNYHDFRGDRWFNIETPTTESIFACVPCSTDSCETRHGHIYTARRRTILLVRHPSTIRLQLPQRLRQPRKSRDYLF